MFMMTNLNTPNPRIKNIVQAIIRDDIQDVRHLVSGDISNYHGPFLTVYKSYQQDEVELAYNLISSHFNNIEIREDIEFNIEYLKNFRKRLLSRNNSMVDRDINNINQYLLDLQAKWSSYDFKISQFTEQYLKDEPLNLYDNDSDDSFIL